MDTNVLAYAEGAGDPTRVDRARELLQRLTSTAGVDRLALPAQVCGELYNVLRRRMYRSGEEAVCAVMSWVDAFDVAEASWREFQAAFELSSVHGLQFWDALIVCTAAQQRCRILLSEDMHEGFTWRGVTVVNPFATEPHPLLRGILLQG
ncbi:MAG TPA: PIN domain-containing protein [Burkholderiaceae bacterium]|nr:PIN domain-containing protein [Burkholderiaceae bacterium]